MNHKPDVRQCVVQRGLATETDKDFDQLSQISRTVVFENVTSLPIAPPTFRASSFSPIARIEHSGSGLASIYSTYHAI